MVATWKIGSADASLKQNIPRYQNLVNWGMENDMARGVAGYMKGLQDRIPESYFITFRDVTIWVFDFAHFYSEHGRLGYRSLNQEFITLVAGKLQIVGFSDKFNTKYVIEMTMGIDQPDRRQILVGNKTGDLIEFFFVIESRVNEYRLACLIKQQVTVFS